MTTFSDAEAARLRAVAALRDAGLTEHADRLAALPPITDAKTARAARDCCYPVSDAAYLAWETADKADWHRMADAYLAVVDAYHAAAYAAWDAAASKEN